MAPCLHRSFQTFTPLKENQFAHYFSFLKAAQDHFECFLELAKSSESWG